MRPPVREVKKVQMVARVLPDAFQPGDLHWHDSAEAGLSGLDVAHHRGRPGPLAHFHVRGDGAIHQVLPHQ